MWGKVNGDNIFKICDMKESSELVTKHMRDGKVYSLTKAQEGAFPVVWGNPGLWIPSLCALPSVASSTVVSPVQHLSLSRALSMQKQLSYFLG